MVQAGRMMQSSSVHGLQSIAIFLCPPAHITIFLFRAIGLIAPVLHDEVDSAAPVPGLRVVICLPVAALICADVAVDRLVASVIRTKDGK